MAQKSDSKTRPPRRHRSSHASSHSLLEPRPVTDPQVGDIVWGKIKRFRWWPGIIVMPELLGELGSVAEGKDGMLFLFWFEDGRVSPVDKSMKLIDFREGYHAFTKPGSSGTIPFRNAVFMAIQEFGKIQGLDDGGEILKDPAAWAEEGFPLTHNPIRKPGFLSDFILIKLKEFSAKYHCDEDEPAKFPSPEVNVFDAIRDGTQDLDKVCLACDTELADSELRNEHPLFDASLCQQCFETFRQCAFGIGSDLASFTCCICLKVGEMMLCSEPECFRAYCFSCIKIKATRGILELIKEDDSWRCFLCEPYQECMHGLIRPKTAEWKLNMWRLFHTDAFSCELPTVDINILCLGETCDTVLSVLSILLSLQTKVRTLLLCGFSMKDSEELKSKVPGQTQIERLPSVSDIQDFEKLPVTPIHMIIASSAENESEHLWQSFMDFYCVLSDLRIVNQLAPQISMPPLFVLEVSPPFRKEYNVRITRFLEFEPASWEGRDTLVWTNHPEIWKLMKGSGLPNTSIAVGGIKRKREVRVTRSMDQED